MSDPDVMDWFRKNGANADWVTSVCSGSLILAAAGLLDGYRATTHWSHYDDLASWPAVEVVRDQRVVLDRNRMTAGGVTAGIDFALHLIAEIADADSAARTQLLMEYDPAPPTNFGHPRRCPPEMVTGVLEMLRPMRGGLDAFLSNKDR
jgi:cyclohexyl-isocyanide hydratase